MIRDLTPRQVKRILHKRIYEIFTKLGYSKKDIKQLIKENTKWLEI